jgi:hypothetical protein
LSGWDRANLYIYQVSEHKACYDVEGNLPGAAVKRSCIIFVCVISTGWIAARDRAQDLSPTPPSQLGRALSAVDQALQRESELSSQIASQERANATSRRQLRAVDSDPAGLQRELVDVSAEAAALRRRVAEQKLRLEVAQDKLVDARGRVADRYEQSQAMQSARRTAEETATDLDRLSQPILEQLGDHPDYLEAQALVDAAAEAGEALQAFDAVDPKAQADADAAFDQAMEHVRAIEDAAIDADPKAHQAFNSFKLAQQTLQDLQNENEKRIAADPRVDAAQFVVDLEQSHMNDSTSELAVAEKRLSALRQPTGPNAGPPTELANQLKEGEARLHDLTDQLDQARIARRDADQRLREVEGSIADSRPSDTRPSDGGTELWPAPYSPAPAYIPDYGYGDDVAYAYPYGGYRYYAYDPFYCPAYYGPYWSFGLFFGTSFHRHSFFDRYYAGNFNHFRNDSWRNRYDSWRGRDSFAGGRSSGGQLSFTDRHGNSSRDSFAGSRSNVVSIRRSTGVERNYNGGTVSTYNYRGSTASHSSLNQVDSGRGRYTDVSRSSADDSGARHAAYSDSGRSSGTSRDRTVSGSHVERSSSTYIRGSDASSGPREVSGDSSRGGSGGDSSSSAGGSSRGSASSGGGGGYSGSPSSSSGGSGGGSSRGSSGSSGGGSSRGGGSSGGGGGGGRH